MMQQSEKTRAIILLIVLIAIGGVVMYGEKTTPTKTRPSFNISPTYVPSR